MWWRAHRCTMGHKNQRVRSWACTKEWLVNSPRSSRPPATWRRSTLYSPIQRCADVAVLAALVPSKTLTVFFSGLQTAPRKYNDFMFYDLDLNLFTSGSVVDWEDSWKSKTSFRPSRQLCTQLGYHIVNLRIKPPGHAQKIIQMRSCSTTHTKHGTCCDEADLETAHFFLHVFQQEQSNFVRMGANTKCLRMRKSSEKSKNVTWKPRFNKCVPTPWEWSRTPCYLTHKVNEHKCW